VRPYLKNKLRAEELGSAAQKVQHKSRKVRPLSSKPKTAKYINIYIKAMFNYGQTEEYYFVIYNQRQREKKLLSNVNLLFIARKIQKSHN
jgi:hypothetical protein